MGPTIYQQHNFASHTLSAANDKLFYPIIPIIVTHVGFVVSTTLTTTAAVLTWDIALNAASAVSPTGAAALGTTTATSTTMAAGKGVFLDVQAVKGTRIVYPGECVRVYTSTTAAAGVVVPIMVFSALGFPSSAGQRDWVTSHPGSTTNPLPTTSLAEVVA